MGKQRCAEHRADICSRKNVEFRTVRFTKVSVCLLYTSDAADERSSVDLGGRRIIKKKQKKREKKKKKEQKKKRQKA